MRKNMTLWGITVLLICLNGYVWAATAMIDLGAVMHDLHCPEHGSLR
jgi:hypothetical protein